MFAKVKISGVLETITGLHIGGSSAFSAIGAAWLCLLFIPTGHIWAALLPQLYLLPHFMAWQKMVKIKKGKELNSILGETSRNMLLFGVLLAFGLIL